jgi:hypothetical protein
MLDLPAGVLDLEIDVAVVTFFHSKFHAIAPASVVPARKRSSALIDA